MSPNSFPPKDLVRCYIDLHFVFCLVALQGPLIPTPPREGSGCRTNTSPSAAILCV